MAKLYYIAPLDASFEEMKKACIEVWGQYIDSPGNYYEEKMARVSHVQNVEDNFMYLFAMFDWKNQFKVVQLLSVRTKEDLKARMIDGGNDEAYLTLIGL